MAAPDLIDVPVRWAHPTELVDPQAYLTGQELFLTVGSSLDGEDRCRDFVDHLIEAGASALGCGVGDVTEEVPPSLPARPDSWVRWWTTASSQSSNSSGRSVWHRSRRH